MKYSLKKEYTNLFEFKDTSIKNIPYNISVNNRNLSIQPTKEEPKIKTITPDDTLEDPKFFARLSANVNSFLNNNNTIPFKINNTKTQEVNLTNRQVFEVYFVLLREGIEKLQQNNEIRNILNEGDYTPEDFAKNLFVLSDESGGGDSLLINVIESENAKDFILNIIVLLYRKLIDKKKMIPRQSQDLIDLEENLNNYFISYLTKVVNVFKNAIIKYQSSLSTTFGTTFEVIALNRIKEKLQEHENPDWTPRDLGIDKSVLLRSDLNLASKKATILILLIIKNKFDSNNEFYNKLVDKRIVLSDDFWVNCFYEVFEDVETKNLEKLDKIIDKYTKLLGHQNLNDIECMEYEDDPLLTKGAAKNPDIILPTANAYFDFIIRTKSVNSNINIGLFDLKCTNTNVPANSQPISVGVTGNNKNNRAIKNIYNTAQALQSLTKGGDANVCFIGLVQAKYQLGLNTSNSNINIEILDVTDIFNKPTDVVNNNIGQTKLNIKSNANTKHGTHTNPQSLENGFINRTNTNNFKSNTVGKTIDFGKYVPELEKIFNFLQALIDCGYTGSFSSDLNGSNYIDMLKNSFANAEEFYKVKNFQTTILDTIKSQYRDDAEFQQISGDFYNVIRQVASDDSYNLETIVRDSILALTFNESNYISSSFSSNRQKSKSNISRYILSVFGGNSKKTNYQIYINNPEIGKFINPARSPSDFQFSLLPDSNASASDVIAIEKPIIDKLSEKLISARNSLNASTDYENASWRDEVKLRGGLSKDAFRSQGHKVDHKIIFGSVLKEVYSHLFKKKIIIEGGLAGHMMHPYEALDMTPRQIIDRIKDYNTSQRIIEKVDGQNLFFTVEQDGTLMFARNKEDMTHDDLVTKFTGHPAELPFVEGGNAIKRGVEQWLSSAGDAGEMEIREIFHQDGETKSFINFEIMHPDKPNQIIYDKKYIVFHSIVDFVNSRETTYSTNKGQRLEKLIRLMTTGVASAGFTLASNRTINLNQLTNVQIQDYVNRIKEVTQQLDISESQFLGDGIENQIKFEIEREGIRISDEAARLIYDFALYGESKSGNKIKSKDFISMMSKEDAAKLRSIGLTNATKALKKVQRIISPFKEIFVDLGIDLLQGVKSAYMSEETNQININILKDKLQTAVDDLITYMKENSDDMWEPEVHRLMPHVNKVIDKDIDLIVSTAVEGGVYDNQGDLLKVTGGFAPLNQILGAAYRDRKGIFPTFKQKFMQQESNRRSLKAVFNLIY